MAKGCECLLNSEYQLMSADVYVERVGQAHAPICGTKAGRLLARRLLDQSRQSRHEAAGRLGPALA